MVFQKTLTRFWTANCAKYENIIIDAIKRNTSDLELRKGKTKVGKQGVRSLYLFKISKSKIKQRFREFNKLFSDI